MKNNSPVGRTPSERLYQRTREKNIPLICTFELTRRCNLRCRHCYLGERKPSKGELTTKQVKQALRQFAAAGTLTLAFTGGEIFLRSDLRELCSYARKLHFDLRLFSNGTLITAEDARFFSKLSLNGFDISLYGKKETHENITRVNGSFEASTRAVKLLRERQIPVNIKTPLMTLNIKDLPWLKKFTKSNNAKLKLDPILTPLDDGGKKVLRYRLSAQSLTKVYEDIEVFVKPKTASFENDLTCSAGHNLFSIGYSGSIAPCIQLPISLGNVKEKPFKEIWSDQNKPLRTYRNIDNKTIGKCKSCRDSLFCQRCPGIALIEDGSLTGPSKIACKINSIIRNL